ncbi:MAG: hypothetical protein DWQ01_04660 [Planctomycetota bacterium]|nr:MAG: hypothetical protein DWQ01_04660 [Planctomycetota bacterium]
MSLSTLAPSLVLLGPQRHQPTVRPVLDSLQGDGPPALLSAGWQEREAEHQELSDHLGHEVLNLELWERAETLFQEDSEYLDAFRRRQDRLLALQRLYRFRLEHVLECARNLLKRPAGEVDLVEIQSHAVQQVRDIDAHHLLLVDQVRSEFYQEWDLQHRPAAEKHLRAVEDTLARCSVLCIAGGHVGVILNRLEMFGVLDRLQGQPVVAWAAGAMALGETVVLFHDRPPQGQGNAEVFARGMALFPDLLPLPHAKLRLELSDPSRVSLFARRFQPLRCVLFNDSQARMNLTEDGWQPGPGMRCMGEGGKLSAWAEKSS